jgi:Trypsin-co-occurring domain 1
MSTSIPVMIDGQTIYVEVEKTYGSEDTTSLDKTLERVQDTFDQAKSTIVCVARGTVEAIRTMDQLLIPDEFTMDFAIRFTAEGNAILAKTSAEANLKVSMTYKHKKVD